MWSRQRSAAFDQPLVANDVKRLETDGSRERVAAEGRAVRSRREDIHHFAVRHEDGDGQHAAAERLAQHHAVGKDILMLKGEPRTGAAEARLDFVQQQQDAAFVAQSTHPVQASRSAAR